MDPNQLEQMSGARFTYRAFPNCQDNLDKFQVPLSMLVTPQRRLEDLPLLVSHPLKCGHCSALINPYCQISATNFTWGCCFCGKINKLTEEYRMKLGGQAACYELDKSRFVVEYEPPEKHKAEGDDFVFLVDLCQSEVNLTALKKALIDCVNGIPIGSSFNRIAVIGYARNLFFYIQDPNSQLSRCIMVNTSGTTEETAKTLGAIYDKDRILNVTQNHASFFFTDKEALVRVINSLEPEPWLTSPNSRPMRATGKALEKTLSFLDITGVTNGSRIVLFTAGPCTVGKGATSELDIAAFTRKHDDIEGGKAKELFEQAKDFYNGLAAKAVHVRTTIDIFGFSLDEFGLTEMNALSTKTGGIVTMNEEFKQDHFAESLARYFRIDEAGKLSMGSGALIEVHLSKELRVQGCIGPCRSLENKSTLQATVEVGECRTNSWFLGGTDLESTLLFFFALAEQTQAKGYATGTNCYIQFVLTYKPNGGVVRKRVLSFERPILNSNSPAHILPHIDQLAIVATYAKLVAYKFAEHDEMVVIRFLDKVLINLLKLFRTSASGIPAELNEVPQYLYYLRKSNSSKKFTTSMDEMTFYRYSVIRECLDNVLVIIQPQVTEYSLNSEEPTPVLPDIDCLKKDVILLADTFFHVITWEGSTIKSWIDQGYHNKPDYEHLAKLIEAPKQEIAVFTQDRVLCPSKVKAFFGSPTERLLKSRLNPENKTIIGANESIDAGNFISEDATLSSFVSKIIQVLAQP